MKEQTTTPRERPLLMRGPLVCATLRDVNPKTVTRRLVQPMAGKQREWLTRDLLNKVPHGEIINGGWQMHHPKAGTFSDGVHVAHDSPLGWIRCPYGVPGDRLWIRETWADADIMYQGHSNDLPGVVAYRADRSALQLNSKRPTPVPKFDLDQWNWDALKWRPSIHMPRALSRITLEIVSVRVERLQDITEEDARAEGLCEQSNQYGRWYHHDPSVPVGLWSTSPITAFRNLWDSITDASTSWVANPYVWRIEYRRIEP